MSRNLEEKPPIKMEMKIKENELCRLCAEKSFEYSSVFIDDLHEALRTNFGLVIKESDNWPKVACKSCLNTTKVCLNFITTLRASEATLRNLYGDWRDVEVKPEIEMIDIKPNPLEMEFENESPVEDVTERRCLKRQCKKEEPLVTTEPKKKRGRPRKQPTSQTEITVKAEEASSASHSPVFMEDPILEDIEPIPEETSNEQVKGEKRKIKKRRKSKKITMTKKKSCPRKARVENQTYNTSHISEENIQKIEEFFKMDCDLCQESFTKFKDLQGHYREVHQRKGYVMCCNVKFNRPFKVLEHLEHHLNPDAFKCTECGKKFKNRYGLSLHTENSHTPQELHKYRCPTCPKTFMSIHRYRNHLAVHIEDADKSHVCPHCSKAFALRSGMQIHMKLMHEKVAYHVCEICAKMFKNKDVFVRHQRLHSGEKIEKLPCPICGRLFGYSAKLKLHIERHNLSKEIFKCHICSKISPNKQALQSHIKYVHIRQRKHKCNLCSAAFKVPHMLTEHMATHTSNQILYTCLFCPKLFNSSANKYSHQKRQHPVEYEEMRKKKDAESLGNKDE